MLGDMPPRRRADPEPVHRQTISFPESLYARLQRIGKVEVRDVQSTVIYACKAYVEAWEQEHPG